MLVNYVLAVAKALKEHSIRKFFNKERVAAILMSSSCISLLASFSPGYFSINMLAFFLPFSTSIFIFFALFLAKNEFDYHASRSFSMALDYKESRAVLR